MEILFRILILSPVVYVPLLLLGLAGSLFASVRLLQLKEWRWDRLREHLREEGFVRSVWGRPRMLLTILSTLIFLAGWLYLLANILQSSGGQVLGVQLMSGSSVIAILGHGFLSIVEIFRRRHALPRWTAKAMTVTALSIALSFLLPPVYAMFWYFVGLREASLAYMWLFGIVMLPVVLPMIQCIFVGFSWIILLPLDRFLKRRILEQAKVLRAAHSDLTVIGVTGSVGKTTVKELLAHLLYDRGAIATPAYVNSEMGVAKWMIQELGKRNPKFLIVEMGAYRKGEIALLCTITKPHYGVLTFIGPQHTALFGSLQAIADAKAELLENLPPLGKAFVNGDCQPCRDVRHRAGCPVVTIGTGGECDLEAFDIEESGAGLRFRVKDTVYTVPLNGSHNVTNVLLSIAVALELKMAPTEIAASLRTFTPLAKTFSVRTERGVRVLDDTHNASPMSFKAALAWAKGQPESPKILLTSGLMELGEEQPAIHRDLGAYAAGIVDRVIFLNKKNVHDFQEGYGKNIEILSPSFERIPRGALLLCISRMPSSAIEKILPS